MEKQLSLFVLQTDTVNSATDVDFDNDIFFITDNEFEAYRYFFEEVCSLDQDWDERTLEREPESRTYTDLTEDEKNKVARDWLTDWREGKEVHQFPIEGIKGVERLTAPLKEEITSLENKMRINTLKASIPKSIPDEIVDCVIAPYL